MAHGVARANQDVAGNQILVRGSTNVFTNNRGTVVAHDSTNASGVIVAQGSTTVFVNNKPIARESDVLANGQTVSSSSTTVFANS